MNSCPIGNNEFPLACESWNMISQSGVSGATSDYYNTCGGISFVAGECYVSTTSGIPQSCTGYQYPRTGEGYCGFLAYVEAMEALDYKEYIGTELLEPMIAGATYCVEFYVSLADSCHFAVDEIAAFFGSDSLPQVWVEPLSLVPQIINTNGVIDDKNEWVKITGYFTAAGNEEYMFIGSYNNYSNTTINNIINEPLGDPNNSNLRTAYYYVDDVSVCLQESGICQCEVFHDGDPVVMDNSDLDYLLPNVFSPNSDLNNDLWTTNFISENEYVIILNRWGNEMIRLDIDNPTWDGKVDGIYCSEGVYFYISWMREEQRHGFIQLIK